MQASKSSSKQATALGSSDGQVVVRTKRSFGDPDSTLTPHGSTPRTAASLKDVGLTDVIKAAIDEYVLHGG
jgi:hypothetical protein